MANGYDIPWFPDVAEHAPDARQQLAARIVQHLEQSGFEN
jgi:hypothetical protein